MAMRSICRWAAVVLLVSCPTGSPGFAQTRVPPDVRGVVQALIVEIGGRSLEPDGLVVIPEMVEGDDLDVTITAYAIRPDVDDLFVEVGAPGAGTQRFFGPARPVRTPTHEMWRVTGVVLDDPAGPRSRYDLRPVVVPKGERPGDVRHRTYPSAPVGISVLRWLPRPSADVTIDTIQRRPVDGGAMAVPWTAEVSGRASAPGATVYLVKRPVNTGECTVLGAARVVNGRWTLLARFDAPGQPAWRTVDLAAVQLEHDPPRRMPCEALLSKSERATDWVRIWLEDEGASPLLERGFLRLIEYSTAARPARPLANVRKIRIDGPAFAVVGGFEALPEGFSVYGLTQADESAMWEVAGPAVVMGDHRWWLPRIEAAYAQAATFVAAACEPLPGGIVDYDTWREKCGAISEPLSIENPEWERYERPSPSISWNRVMGVRVGSGDQTIRGLDRGPAVVTASDLRPGDRVGVAYTRDGRLWEFEPTLQVDEETYRTAPLSPDGRTLLAVVVAGTPPTMVSMEAWRPYARAISSSMITIEPPASAIPEGVPGDVLRAGWAGGSPGGVGGAPLLVWLVAIVAALVLLQYYFRATSRFFEEIATIGTAVNATVRTMPAVLPTLEGLLVLLVGAVAMVSYYPIFSDVLKGALDLPRGMAQGLALAVMALTALAGMTWALTRLLRDVLHPIAFSVVVLVTALVSAALVGFTTLLYVDYYRGRTEPGSLVPFALGALAFFGAAAEQIGAYWVTRLLLPYVAWLFRVVSLLPGAALYTSGRLISVVFSMLPSRATAETSGADVLGRATTRSHPLTAVDGAAVHLESTPHFGKNTLAFLAGPGRNGNGADPQSSRMHLEANHD